MSKKKVEIEYIVKQKQEIELDIPSDAELQSISIDGVNMSNNLPLNNLFNILDQSGIKHVKIGHTEIPIQAIGALLPYVGDLIKLIPSIAKLVSLG